MQVTACIQQAALSMSITFIYYDKAADTVASHESAEGGEMKCNDVIISDRL